MHPHVQVSMWTDMLEIIIRDGKVICLWHDCQWDRNSGITSILWSKAIELNGGTEA